MLLNLSTAVGLPQPFLQCNFYCLLTRFSLHRQFVIVLAYLFLDWGYIQNKKRVKI